MSGLDFLPTLLAAAVKTLEIAAAASLVALAVAFTLGIARFAGPRPVRAVALVLVEFFRGVSALVLLFWLFYALPLVGIRLDAFPAAILGLGLNAGAYGAEIVRGGLAAVPRGQAEAARALNFSRGQALWRVLLPQAFVDMLPPFGNLAVELLKSTALVSMITITELTFRAAQLNVATLRTVEIFVQVLLIYFVMALAITGLMRLAERTLKRRQGRVTGLA